jgi:superfamily I DNA and/or RNA helicase
MYDISNTISYQGIMKQQTLKPKAEKERKFISPYSMWVQTAGQERGSKDHFVDAQGEKVCELLETAFQKQGPKPSVYIISPFTSVVRGVKEYIESYCAKHPETAIVPGYILSTKNKCIGTVHTFQGKEADEVIFVMGCDDSSQASGAIGWVPPNIVNVAATRAKFRFYVVGDQKAWSVSPSMKTVSEILQAEEDKVLTA